MEEFWNLVIGQVAAFIMGMATHSALGHSYGGLMIKLFHRRRCVFCGSRAEAQLDVCEKCRLKVTKE